MIKLLDLLIEIGESSAKPYPYTLGQTNSSGTSAHLYFTTDLGTNYQVVVIDAKPSYEKEDYHDFIFSFKVIDEDHSYISNKQELYRVMATVIKIMRDWINKFSEETVKRIQFTPAKTKGDDDTRRQNLYMAYIRKQIPNWKFELETDNGEETFIFYNPNYKPATSLKEVGDANIQPYKTIKRSDEIYEFITSDGIVYFIELVENWTGQLLVSFRLKEDSDYAVTTNKGDMFKIMATVINEVKKYLKQNHHIDEIVIMPSKSNDSDSRRTNIYMAYIKKQMPKNWTVQLDRIGGEAGVDEIIMRKQIDN